MLVPKMDWHGSAVFVIPPRDIGRGEQEAVLSDRTSDEDSLRRYVSNSQEITDGEPKPLFEAHRWRAARRVRRRKGGQRVKGKEGGERTNSVAH